MVQQSEPADGKTSQSTRSIVPYLPFNQDLNRLTLKVTNIAGKMAKVTWGNETKEFSKDHLAAGINLTAEFATSPFEPAFAKLQGAVAQKQNLETMMIRQYITNFRGMPQELKNDPEMHQAVATMTKAFVSHWQKAEDNVRQLLVPVKHTLKIE